MKTWSLAAKMEVCGNCIAFIERGQKMMIISAPGASNKVRCERCAGEAAPTDLSAGVEIVVDAPARARPNSLPFD